MDTRNLILAIVLSVGILLGFQYLFPITPPPAPTETAQTQTDATGTLPTAPASDAIVSREEAIARTPRVSIESARLSGSINLLGARIDALTLTDYRETTKPGSAPIHLLSPAGAADAYFADFGWSSATAALALPDANTRWTADRQTLTPDSPVTLTWENGQGLRFERTIALDRDYMFTITDRVRNSGEAPVELAHYSRVRRALVKNEDAFISHQGPIGVFDAHLKEVNYDKIAEAPDQSVVEPGEVGWLGITDKYWLTAIAPAESKNQSGRFAYAREGAQDIYQVGILGPKTTLAQGAASEAKQYLFAGAKEMQLIDRYASALAIPRFDLAVDFGWFYFLTKPIFVALLWLAPHLGNVGLAIMALTVAIKLLFFPLANKSYRAMAKMRALAPEMARLKEQFGEDRMKLNQEMMALYKKSGASPLAGCLPIIIQIPVFFALYKVLYVSIEMRHAPFYGWIHDLSAPDPTNIFTLFGLLPDWMPFQFMHIGLWPILMGASMWVQMKLNPTPPDPMQARVMMLMPFVLVFVFAPFAAGLVIYWTWNNILSIAQQWWIIRSMEKAGLDPHARAVEKPKAGE